MIQHIFMLLLFGVAALAVAGVTRLLRRSISPALLLGFSLLPILFALPGFFANRTILPVDHAMAIPPWLSPGEPRPRNLNLNDVATQIAPWAKAVRMAWKEMSLPLRDRWNGCGGSLAGNGQAAPFSPLTFLGFVLPLALAFNLVVAVKLLLILTGTWLWLRELGVSREAAVFGALAFGLSMTVTPWLLFPNTAVITLWPWVLALIEIDRDRSVSGRSFVALVLLLFLLPLQGHIESVASIAAFVGLWLATRILAGVLGEPGRQVRRLAAAAAASLGLSAFALFPQILTILSSNRLALVRKPFWEAAFSWWPHGPVWNGGLVTTLFPRTFGDAIDSPPIPGGAGSFPEMALGHFGIIGLAIFFLCLRPGSARSRTELSLLAPLLWGLGTAIGLWPFAEIVGHLPGLQSMFPLRFLSWFAVAGAAIAAFEIDRFHFDFRHNRKPALFALGIAGTLAGLAVASYLRLRALHWAAQGISAQKRALLMTLAFLLTLALVVAAAARRPGGSVALPGLIALLVGAELFLQAKRLYQFGDPAKFFPPTPLVEFLRSRPFPFRVVGDGSTLFPNTNIFAALEDVRTHNAVERRDYVEFLDGTCGYPPGDYFKRIGNLNCTALDFLNVRYLIAEAGRISAGGGWQPVYSGPDGTVFENSKVLPRVFAPDWIRAATGAGTVRDFASLDWPHEAIVVPDRGSGFSAPETASNGSVHVSDYREKTNSASFRAEAPPAGAVVVASLVQDGGWTARDESGSTLSTSRANGPFLAVALRGGDHRVRLTYAAPGSKAGALVSLATLAFLGLVLARRRGAPSSKPGHV